MLVCLCIFAHFAQIPRVTNYEAPHLSKGGGGTPMKSTQTSAICVRSHNIHSVIESNQIKSLLLSHHHIICALLSEILESVLQTVQKQFTYSQYTQCTIRQTLQLYTLCTHSTFCTHINTIICEGATDYT